jgi:hypothetical protein
MTEEEKDNIIEEKKPMEQLRELRQQYPEINDVIISKTTLNKILSNIHTSSNFGEKNEGIIFGRLTETQIIISSLIPSTLSEFSNINITNYLETSRLDSTKIGFYLCDTNEEILTHQKLKTFMEFQKIFPNCVILTIDTNALKTNCYPFKCFRISEKIMEKFEEEEIEQNIYLEKSTITKEFYKQMFKKLNPNVNMIKELNLKIGNDLLNLFEDLAEKKYLNEDENEPENNYYFGKSMDINLNKKIRDLNKGCEKLIEEQKKYINFYKNKKLHNNEISFTKDDNKKGMKSLGNIGEEKFELFNLGLCSQNLKEVNHELKKIINKKEIDSFAAFNLSS